MASGLSGQDTDMSSGYRLRRMSFCPIYKDTVVETVTSTMVDRIQMLASPTAFCFIR